MKVTLEYIQFFWSHRKSKLGLALALLAISSTVFAISTAYDVAVVYAVVAVVGVALVNIAIWMVSSGRWILSSEKITVAYSLRSTDPQSQRLIATTMELLKTKLDKLQILDKFRFVEVGSDVITTIADAQKFSNRHQLNLLIPGIVVSGNVESRYHFDLNNFFFTYHVHVRQVGKNPQLADVLKKDLSLFTSNRDWMIDTTNDLRRIDEVAANFMEIILSTVAFGLALNVQHIEKALVLIESLLPLLENRLTAQPLPTRFDKESGRLYVPIEVLRSGRLRSVLSDVYTAHAFYLFNDGEYRRAIDAANKGLDSGAGRADAYAVLAICYFYLGDIAEAERMADEIGRLDDADPRYLVDKAFFLIRRRDYQGALAYYDRLISVGLPEESQIPFQVISFLSEIRVQDASEPAYDFAIGLMHYHFGDGSVGVQLLRGFLDKTTGDRRYSDIRVRAERCLRSSSGQGHDSPAY